MFRFPKFFVKIFAEVSTLMLTDVVFSCDVISDKVYEHNKPPIKEPIVQLPVKPNSGLSVKGNDGVIVLVRFLILLRYDD